MPFKKKGEDVYFLVWTTTPWTLIANVALCVNPDEEYVLISVKLINYNFITKVFGNLLVNQFIIKLSQEIAKIGKDRGIFGRLDENNFVLLMKKSNLDIESFTKYSSELHTISEDKYLLS